MIVESVAAEVLLLAGGFVQAQTLTQGRSSSLPRTFENPHRLPYFDLPVPGFHFYFHFTL